MCLLHWRERKSTAKPRDGNAVSSARRTAVDHHPAHAAIIRCKVRGLRFVTVSMLKLGLQFGLQAAVAGIWIGTIRIGMEIDIDWPVRGYGLSVDRGSLAVFTGGDGNAKGVNGR